MIIVFQRNFTIGWTVHLEQSTRGFIQGSRCVSKKWNGRSQKKFDKKLMFGNICQNSKSSIQNLDPTTTRFPAVYYERKTDEDRNEYRKSRGTRFESRSKHTWVANPASLTALWNSIPATAAKAPGPPPQLQAPKWASTAHSKNFTILSGTMESHLFHIVSCWRCMSSRQSWLDPGVPATLRWPPT